jgi:hypothetical protein
MYEYKKIKCMSIKTKCTSSHYLNKYKERITRHFFKYLNTFHFISQHFSLCISTFSDLYINILSKNFLDRVLASSLVSIRRSLASIRTSKRCERARISKKNFSSRKKSFVSTFQMNETKTIESILLS